MNGQFKDGIFLGEKVQGGLREPGIIDRIGFSIRGDFGVKGVDLMGRDEGGGGQADGGVVVIEMVEGLDEVFSEGIVSEDGGALVVFESGGEEFCGAGGVLVHEQGDRKIKGGQVGVGVIGFCVLF